MCIRDSFPSDGAKGSSSRLSISGTAEAGASIEIFSGAQVIATTIADRGGTWSKAVALEPGAYMLTAKATDLAGNQSFSSAPVSVSINNSAPQPVLSSDAPQSFSQNFFEVSVDFGRSVWDFDLDGVALTNGTVSTLTNVESGKYTLRITPIAPGNVLVRIDEWAASDAWGNLSLSSEALSRTYTVPTPSPTPSPDPTLVPTATPTLTPTPKPTITPKPSPTPSPKPTPMPTPRPTDPAPPVYQDQFDFDGDRLSDLLFVFDEAQSVKYIATLTDKQGYNEGPQFEGSLGQPVAVGTADTNGNGNGEIVSVKKTGSLLAWEATSPLTSNRHLLFSFGTDRDTPVVGCHTQYRMIPAVMAKSGKKRLLRLAFASLDNPYETTLPKGTKTTICSPSFKGESKVFSIFGKKERLKIAALSLRGDILIPPKLLPRGSKKPQFFAMPRIEAEPLAGLLYKKGKGYQAAFLKPNRTWILMPIPQVTRSSKISYISVGTNPSSKQSLLYLHFGPNHYFRQEIPPEVLQ